MSFPGPQSSLTTGRLQSSLTTGRLRRVIEAWADAPLLVVGDAMLDEWRFAGTDRLCREAPAPVFTLHHRQAAPGGAGNTAVNLSRLGACPHLVAVVGADEAGATLRRRLADCGVRDRTVSVPGGGTAVKRRLLAEGQIVVREDEGGWAGPVPVAALEAALETGATTLIVCDYRLGARDERVRAWLVAHRDAFSLVAVDAHDPAPWRALRPTLITPSFAEVSRVAPLPATGDRSEQIRAYADDLLRLTGARIVAVTLDVDGAVVVTAGAPPYRTGATPAPSSHAVGAGDAYLAAFTLALVGGSEPDEAAYLAQLAADATLAELGTIPCDRATLLAALNGHSSIVDGAELVAEVARRRAAGQRIVFTNGCFDVLHRGHVGYLQQARALGDALVVAVNSDASVRRLKGPDRPVNPVEDRAAVLAALSCVDYVVVFEADSPTTLIEAVRPELYVKGGDYLPDLVPEAALIRRLGGEVRIVGYIADRSTSAIIDQIRARNAIIDQIRARNRPERAEARGT